MCVELDKDLNKSRIEVLRDATKDVSDTLRALDRKTSYIITLTMFIFSSYSLIVLKINEFQHIGATEMLFFLPLIYLIAATYFYFYSYSPIQNPTIALDNEDNIYVKNTFFILHTDDKANLIDDLAANYILKAPDIKGLAKVLYAEIIKLSKIRERRINLIKIGNRLLLFGSIFIMVEIITLFIITPLLLIVTMIGAELAYWILYFAFLSKNQRD